MAKMANLTVNLQFGYSNPKVIRNELRRRGVLEGAPPVIAPQKTYRLDRQWISSVHIQYGSAEGLALDLIYYMNRAEECRFLADKARAINDLYTAQEYDGAARSYRGGVAELMGDVKRYLPSIDLRIREE